MKIKLSDWWNDARAIKWLLGSFILAYVVAMSVVIFRGNMLSDTQYLSVRITQLQAEQRLSICKAMLPGTREVKGYNKDCTDFTSNN